MSGEDKLRLKWGTLKAYDLKSEAAVEAARRYNEIGQHSLGAATQRDTPEQKKALCELVDAIDGTIYLDWDGRYVDKDEAKKYIMEYEK